jgi:hypothetical protein
MSVQRKGSIILDPLTNILYFSDGTTWIPVISGSTMGGGLPTVGTIDANFTSIAEAYAAGIDSMRVITSINETAAGDLSTGPKHVRIEIAPGVDITNSITPIAPWFTGDDTMLTIVGAGTHIDDTTIGLSSRIVLQTGQALRSGVDAELTVRDVRFSGSDSNTLTAGTSTIENCRFDTAVSFNFNGFVDNLYVNNCFFETDVNIESLGVLDASGVIFTNNNFESHNLNVNAATFSSSNISDNVWEGSLTIDNEAVDIVISGNTMDSIVFSGDLRIATVSGNTMVGSIISENITDGAITGNTCSRAEFRGDVIDLTVSGNVVLSVMEFEALVTRSLVSSNFVQGFVCFRGNATTTTISGNNVNGNLFFTSDLTDSDISNNIADSNLEVEGGTSDCVFSGNRCECLKLGSASANSTNVSVIGNVLGSGQDIVFGDSGFGRPINCTIIGNIATGGITSNSATVGNTNTIVGNRVAGGGINGFAADAASTGLNV